MEITLILSNVYHVYKRSFMRMKRHLTWEAFNISLSYILLCFFILISPCKFQMILRPVYFQSSPHSDIFFISFFFFLFFVIVDYFCKWCLCFLSRSFLLCHLLPCVESFVIFNVVDFFSSFHVVIFLFLEPTVVFVQQCHCLYFSSIWTS